MSDKPTKLDGEVLQRRAEAVTKKLSGLIMLVGREGIAGLDAELAAYDAETLRETLAGAVGVLVGGYLEEQEAHRRQMLEQLDGNGGGPTLH